MSREKLKTTKFLGKVLLTVLVAFLCFVTGCSEDVENGATGYVRFASSDNARSIEEGNKLMYPAENLYWAYTAVKKDGNYTVGQSEETTGSAVSGVSVSDGGRLLLLKPMKSGPETGLGTVGPFSVGTWVFKLYGYKGCKLDGGVYKFSDLVYTSSKEVVIDNVSIAAAKDVVFELTVDTTTVAKGKLELGRFKMFLPENQKIFGTKPALASDGTPLKAGAEIIVKIFKGEPAADNLIAASTTIITDDVTIKDDAFDINYFVFAKNTDGTLRDEFDAGDTDFYFAAEYLDEHTYSQKDIVFAEGGYKFSGNTDYTKYAYDDGYAPVFDAQAYPVYFRAGVVTTLDGEINEFMGMAESSSSAQYGAYVASKGSGDGIKYYLTLDEAAKDITVTGDITVLRHIKNAGNVTAACTVVPSGYVVKNLTVSGSTTKVTMKTQSGGTYEFATNGTVIKEFSAGMTSGSQYVARFATTGGNVTVNAPDDNVYHTGTCANITVTAVKNDKDNDLGYHLRQSSALTVLDVRKGFIDLGENTTITTLTIGGTVATTVKDVVLRGRKSTTVGNIDTLRDNTAFNVTGQTAFATVTLNGNGGKKSATDTTNKFILFGIEGMYLNLPAYTETSRSGKPYLSPIFVRDAYVFTKWDTLASVSDTAPGVMFGDEAKIVAGVKPDDGTTYVSNIDLYAQWESPDYLCFTSKANGSVVGMLKGAQAPTGISLEYSYDLITWDTFVPGTTSITLDNGKKVYFRGNNKGFYNHSGVNFSADDCVAAKNVRFSITGTVEGSGSVMSLLDNTGVSKTITEPAAFAGLFRGCTGLTKAPEFSATELSVACYWYTFSGCTSLVSSMSELPAYDVPDYAYSRMFNGCSNLVTVFPEIGGGTIGVEACRSIFNSCTKMATTVRLPSTKLSRGCYWYFYKATSVVTASELPAEDVPQSAYSNMYESASKLKNAPSTLGGGVFGNNACTSMFYGCTLLENAPALPSKDIGENAYYAMFSGCTSLKEAPELPAKDLPRQCYREMFLNCSALKKAPSVIGATGHIIDYFACGHMFNGCTSLKIAPNLLCDRQEQAYCYYYMFYGCTALEIAYELPPMRGGYRDYACQKMFYGCTNLRVGPRNFIWRGGGYAYTNAGASCCEGMFEGCEKLGLGSGGYAVVIDCSADACGSGGTCFSRMFYGCKEITSASITAFALNSNMFANMFVNCAKLTSITFMMKRPELPAGMTYGPYFGTSRTTNWVSGVSATGTFSYACDSSYPLDTTKVGVNAIPSGWTIRHVDFDGSVI